MINIMSGTTAVTLTPNNAVSKGAKGTSNGAGSKTSGTGSSSIANVNSTAVAGSNNAVNNTAGNAVQVQNTQNNQQSTSANAMQAQVQAANTISADYSKEAMAALQSRIRKEYIDRNYYIDEGTNIPVIQIVNNETDRVIGQYPADMYLNLIMRVRENQKSMVNKTSAANQQTNMEQQLMANQKY